MSGNVRPFAWDKNKLDAAQLLAEGDLTEEEVAAKVGVSGRQLRRWKERPEFKAKVGQLAREIEAAVRRKGVARKARRLEALDDRWGRMKRVIAERADDPSLKDVPGGKTGLLVHQVKGVGAGDNFELVHEYAVDVGLLRELRELERQAAQECGEWEEKHEHRHKGTGPRGEIEQVVFYIPDNGRDKPDPTAAGPAGALPDEPG